MTAAQAYILDHTGKVAKTHSGVRSQFAQLALHEPRIDAGLRTFLAKAYRLKQVVDYELGEGSDIPPEHAATAVEEAARFLDCMAQLLGASPEPHR